MSGLLLLTAGAAGLAVAQSVAIGMAVAVAPLIFMGLVRPAALAVLGVGLTCVTTDLTGGAGSVKVAVADALLLLAVAGWFCAVGVGERKWPQGALRAVRPYLLLYVAVLAVATAAHPGASSLIESLQRIQIVVVALVAGAFVLRSDDLRRALGLFLVATSIMAVVYAVTFDGDSGLGNQKNPAGHFMALAVLVAVGSDVLGRLRFALLVPLVIGLFTTGSRGALVGLLAGLVVLPLLLEGQRRRRASAMIATVLICLLLAYSLLPPDAQERLSTIESRGPLTGSLSAGEYTIALREEYRRDAYQIISAQPLLGVGIGNYLAGDLSRGTLTDNPHNVLLLESAEGGLPLGGALTLLLVGSMVILVRIRRQTPLAALAASVQAASIVHGLLDIYWVRGTPTLGWLLIGAAIADAHRRGHRCP